MIDNALRVCDQNRDLPPEQQFVWTLSGWPMNKILEDWPGQTPERQQRVLQAFGTGRFVVHALPSTTHTELLELEDLVRGMVFSSRLSRAVGMPLPRDAKMTDVPGHTWVLPTILKHAGVDFLHIGCNAAQCARGAAAVLVGRARRLAPADDVLGRYGTGLKPPADWPYKTWLALIHTGDNHGPPTAGRGQGLLDQAARKLPGVKVRMGRLSDFGDAILRPRTPGCRWCAATCPTLGFTGLMSIPSGASWPATSARRSPPPSRWTRMLRAWGVRVPDAANRGRGLRAEPAVRRAHLGRRSLLAHSYSKISTFPMGGLEEASGKGRFQRWKNRGRSTPATISARLET